MRYFGSTPAICSHVCQSIELSKMDQIVACETLIVKKKVFTCVDRANFSLSCNQSPEKVFKFKYPPTIASLLDRYRNLF